MKAKVQSGAVKCSHGKVQYASGAVNKCSMAQWCSKVVSVNETGRGVMQQVA